MGTQVTKPVKGGRKAVHKNHKKSSRKKIAENYSDETALFYGRDEIRELNEFFTHPNFLEDYLD